MRTPSQVQTLISATDCEVRFDDLTRRLHATDASIYQVEPLAVAFPKNAAQASSVIRIAAEAGIPVTPRGAGTGLVGGALGAGIILDLARHNQRISEFNAERRTVRVGAGVVLDELNRFLKPSGLCFGPDVATSSRASLGGMIANNSSGARVPVYGTTADHVRSLEILLADGRIERLGDTHDGLGKERDFISRLIREHAVEVQNRFPAGLLKRWPGYGLDRCLRESDILLSLISGSEGTLAGIISAELNLLPLPKEKGLGLIFFASVAEAMQATVQLQRLRPAAIEHIDRILFDQTRGQLQFKAARDLLDLDAQPCESILLVEFFEDVTDRLQEVTRLNLGLRTMRVSKSAEMELVWSLRKAGLSLLTSRPGPAKPVTCVEDTSVRPEDLPEYVAGLESIFRPLNLGVCYYGHAAAGLLHVRPVLDLHKPDDRKKLRDVSDQVAALVKQYRGSLAGEHGVGMARTEYLVDQIGPDLMSVMHRIKHTLDPVGIFNPGKIVHTGAYHIDTHLRTNFEAPLELPFTPVLEFASKDHSFVGNLEQCNGCGGCRKLLPTMCPTYLATGDEELSTRGRANMIRAALESGSWRDRNSQVIRDLEDILRSCLSCKACTIECPSNVNLSLLKAELKHARHQENGALFAEQLFSSIDLLGPLGCRFPRLTNRLQENTIVRAVISRFLGVSAARPLPRFADRRFDHWFRDHKQPRWPRPGQVFLWDDTFVRYYEPSVGQAAVQVLEAAGFEVRLIQGRVCCGRPSFSQGRIDRAAELGKRNLEVLQRLFESNGQNSEKETTPILFLEPSCYSMFVEEYREMRLPGAEPMASRCFLFDEFIFELLKKEPTALEFKRSALPVGIHAHCHAKALRTSHYLRGLGTLVSSADVALMNTGCCGMAGVFGMLDSNIELSARVGKPLAEAVREFPPGSMIIASGTSCRQQIQHLAQTKALHMAEALAQALVGQAQS